MHPSEGRGRRKRRGTQLVAVIATVGLLAAGVADAAPSLKRRARVASSYLVSQQQSDGSFPGFSPLGSTADAVVSLVAAKRGPRAIRKAVGYLEANVAEADTIGEIAKVVMAAVAAGADPLAFGGRNLVQEIVDSEQQNGRYGATTEVFNHALAILALEAAPTADPSDNAVTWLVQAQCGDGGWQFDEPPRAGEDEHCANAQDAGDFFQSDTNTTSYAVQAIAAHPPATPPANSPFKFFRQIRDPEKRGWGYTWTFRLTDTNSTALVIQAFKAAGKALPKGSIRALKKLQYRLCGKRGGAFPYSYEPREGGGYKKTGPDAGATIGGILGLLKRPLPVSYFDVTKAVPKRRSC